MTPTPPSARSVALALLIDVFDRRRPLSEALEQNNLGDLAARDRAFARAMVGVCLRRRGQIEALLGDWMERAPKGRDAPVLHILRLGLGQILFLGVPVHAAVDSTVALVGARHRHLRGMVNAVLRRATRDGKAALAGQDAARLNTPDWLWQSWCAAYGEDTARAIAAVHAQEPPLDFSLARSRDADQWAEKLAASRLPTGSLRRTLGGRVEDLPGYAQGRWWVQDAAAALPARMLLDGAAAGECVYDLCAAPGGKTAQLAAAGLRVTAVDRSAPRMRRLAANLRRLKLAATTVSADVCDWRPDGPAPLVLLDAPCSATGTARRHPDVVWLKDRDSVKGLIGAQDRLLAAAAEVVAPGGLLVYAVCSLQPEEGPARVAEFLRRTPGFSRQPVTAGDLGLPDDAVTAEGEVRTLPSHFADLGGLDGFYAARLKRDG